MRARMFRLLGGVFLLTAIVACHPTGPERAHVEVLFGLDARRQPLPGGDAAEAALGAALFAHRFGARACADCHDPARCGQDGAVHGRATPALADVARQVVFGWDGLGTGLAAVVQHELLVRHGLGDDAALQAELAGSAALRDAFARAAPGAEPTLARAAAALTTHLVAWRTRGRWDRYVEGDDAALTAAERHGVAVFVRRGCATCHGGRNLGGASAHVLGLALPYASADRGREQATGVAGDRFVFRAPMLRHAARTAPYLHDGSIPDLEVAIAVMARHELGSELAPAEIAAITVFLRAVADVDVDAPVPGAIPLVETDHGRR